MLVIAKTRGEHPQGTWRNPGERFEYDGEKPALWMMTAEECDKAKAEAQAQADEANEIIKAQSEAKSKVLAKRNGDKGEDVKGIHAVHRGFGKWDVIGLDGEVINKDGDLNKADASALVETLLAGAAEA